MSSVRKVLGSTAFTAVDVGAARGILPHWRCLKDVAHFIQVEPDVQAHDLIRAENERMGVKSFRLIGAALSGEGGTRTLHVLPFRTSSSLLPPKVEEMLDYGTAEAIVPIQKHEIPTERLAAVLDREQVSTFDIIKLDTQGTELEILSGAGAHRLDDIVCVEAEIGVHGEYTGQASIGDWLTFANKHDFELFDVVPKRAALVNPTKGPRFYERMFGTYRNAKSLGHRLLEVDAFFFRRPSSVKGGVAVRKLAVAYAMYGYFAHAWRVLERAREDGVIAQADYAEATSGLVAWHRSVYRRRAAFDVGHRALEKVQERIS